MKSSPENPDSLRIAVNANSVQTLLIDVKVALTFVQLAEDHGAGEVATRNTGKARVAYDSITRLRPRFSLSPDENASLDGDLDTLKQRLKGLGETF